MPLLVGLEAGLEVAVSVQPDVSIDTCGKHKGLTSREAFGENQLADEGPVLRKGGVCFDGQD